MITSAELGVLLLEFLPEENVGKYIKSAKDLFLYRVVLKNSEPSEFVLSYLLKILRKDVELGYKFNTLPCLQTLKIIIKNFHQGYEFSSEVVRDLFFIFKHFIFHKNENVGNVVNFFIKDQILIDYEVKWLISNYKKSIHIKNRLLRYPSKNIEINCWAFQILKDGGFHERTSEGLGLLIEGNVPRNIKASNRQIVWAIFYSNSTDDIKKKLLRERFSVDEFEDILNVSKRCGFKDLCLELIEFARRKIT